MDTTQKTHFEHSAFSFTGAIARAAATGMQRIARARRIRKDRQWLHEMPDCMLRDIGISRSEIDSVIGYRGMDAIARRGWY